MTDYFLHLEHVVIYLYISHCKGKISITSLKVHLRIARNVLTSYWNAYVPSGPMVGGKYIDGQYIMQVKSLNKKPMEHGCPRVLQQHVETLAKVGLNSIQF